MRTAARLIAEYSSSLSFRDLPEQVVREVVRRFVDSLGVMYGSHGSEPLEAARKAAERFASGGPSSLFGSKTKSSPDWAAFVNGVAVRYLDFNDTYLSREALHPSDMIPGLLALAEALGATGRDLIASIAVAYEVALALAERRDGAATHLTLEDAEGALGASPVRYGRDDHYDVVSAFIKSIRGSDPDAALHWLARMLEAGEDARFIARRLVISASEDVGLADPFALVIADAAARAVEFVGLPEARINLAQATVHLALAPKSNTAYAGLDAASADVRSRPVGEVPMHLRDAHYRGARSLGHGEGYRYPHDDPTGWVDQPYRPEALDGAVYYEPSAHGHEAEIGRLHINISGCINACGHHHVGHIGILGVDKQGESHYQITIGGRQGPEARIGRILGPSLPEAEVPDAVEA
ncbi:MAG: MmgE/PrpD family protein, partial [Nitrososphaerota archaeon]